MKIEKIICDICGREITEPHPTRVEQQAYFHERNFRGYKKAVSYEICDDCVTKLPDLFKALKGGRE